MSKRKRLRKLFSWIYAVFIAVYVAVLAIGIYYMLSKVWAYAEEYETSRPEPVIEAYVDGLSENLADDSMREKISQMPHPFQTDEEVLAIVQELFSDEMTYARTSNTSGSDSITYNIYCGSNLFGQVTLVEDASKSDQSEFGMLPWKVYDEEFYLDGLYTSAQITVPAAYTVQVNGHELGGEYIIESGIHYDVLDEYYEAYPDLPTKVTYKVENLIGRQELTVYDEDGNVAVIDDSKDDSQYIKYVEGDMFNRLSTFADGFTRAYLNYSSGITDPTYGYQLLGAYMQAGSDIDKRMKMAFDGLSWAHTTSLTINSITLNSAIALGQGFYLLDITSDATAVEPGRTSNSSSSMKVIVSDVGGDIRAVTMKYSN